MHRRSIQKAVSVEIVTASRIPLRPMRVEIGKMRSQRDVEHDVQSERGSLPSAEKVQRRGQCTRREVKTTRLEEDCTSGGGPRGALCDKHGRRCHPSAAPSDICLNLPTAALHTQTTDCATAAVRRQDSNEDMWMLRSAPWLGASGHGSYVSRCRNSAGVLSVSARGLGRLPELSSMFPERCRF